MKIQKLASFAVATAVLASGGLALADGSRATQVRNAVSAATRAFEDNADTRSLAVVVKQVNSTWNKYDNVTVVITIDSGASYKYLCTENNRDPQHRWACAAQN